jgi:hypothetical protein
MITTSALISSSKVDGTKVYNPAGEKLGSIESLMIDKISGQVRYAVMAFGGFLGMGTDRHPLPWSTLKYDVNQEATLFPCPRNNCVKDLDIPWTPCPNTPMSTEGVSMTTTACRGSESARHCSAHCRERFHTSRLCRCGSFKEFVMNGNQHSSASTTEYCANDKPSENKASERPSLPNSIEVSPRPPRTWLECSCQHAACCA